jgi:hypothetical protein
MSRRTPMYKLRIKDIRVRGDNERKIIVLDQHFISCLTQRGNNKYYKIFLKLAKRKDIDWLIIRDVFYLEFGKNIFQAIKYYLLILSKIQKNIYFANNYIYFIKNEFYECLGRDRELGIPDRDRVNLIYKIGKRQLLYFLIKYKRIRCEWKKIFHMEHQVSKVAIGVMKRPPVSKEDKEMIRTGHFAELRKKYASELTFNNVMLGNMFNIINPDITKKDFDEVSDDFYDLAMKYYDDPFFQLFLIYSVSILLPKYKDVKSIEKEYNLYKKNKHKLCFFSVYVKYLIYKDRFITRNDFRDIQSLCYLPYVCLVFVDKKNKRQILEIMKNETFGIFNQKIKSFEDINSIEKYLESGFLGMGQIDASE